MRIQHLLQALTLIVLLTTAPLFADVVINTTVGVTAGFFNPATPTTVGGQTGITDPNQAPKAYWDHGSFDANTTTSQCNIGWALENALTGCALQNGSLSDDPAPNAYWSQENGNYDPGFIFSNGSVHDDIAELELRVTGYQALDAFGWFETNSTGTTIGAKHQLFNGSSTVESVGYIPVTTGAYFGLYLTNGNGATFYTTSANNTADANIQHFGLFRVDPATGTGGAPLSRYYIGVEDLQGPSDFDYNDFVVEIAQVPEPTTILLFGTILAGCAMVARRRRNRAQLVP